MGVILAVLAALEGLLERLRLVLGRLEGILDRLGGPRTEKRTPEARESGAPGSGLANGRKGSGTGLHTLAAGREEPGFYNSFGVFFF